MMSFEKAMVSTTVDKLIKGEDYREEVVSAINVSFLEFTLGFFKKIVDAKFQNKDISIDWYKDNFITKYGISPDEAVINSGLNRKTVTNMYNSSKMQKVIIYKYQQIY